MYVIYPDHIKQLFQKIVFFCLSTDYLFSCAR